MAGRTRRTTKNTDAPTAPTPPAGTTPAVPTPPAGFGAAQTSVPSGFPTPPVGGGFGASSAPTVPAAGFAAPAQPVAGFGAAVGGFGGVAAAPKAAAVEQVHAPAPSPMQADPAVTSALSDILAAVVKLEQGIKADKAAAKVLAEKVDALTEQVQQLLAQPTAAATPIAEVAPVEVAASPVAVASAPNGDNSGAFAQAVTYIRQCAAQFYAQPGAGELNIKSPEAVILIAQVCAGSGVAEVAGDPTDPAYQANVVSLLESGGALDANGKLLGI